MSCPTTKLCVAVDAGGNALVSTDPTGGASAWTVTNVDGTNSVNAVACPTASLCVAVDNVGNVVVSTKPSGGPSAWTATAVDSNSDLDGVSCPSAGLCVAVDQEGNIVTSTHPTAGASAWVAVAADGSNPGGFASVSCASARLCVAADLNGNLVNSTNPTGGSSAWSLVPVDAPTGGSNEAGGVSCPTVNLCLALASGSAGNLLLTSTNPTGGASAWTKTTGVANSVPLEALSCPSPRLCVAADPATDIITSTNPTGGAPAWTAAVDEGLPNQMFAGVSCPTLNLCVVVSNDNVVSSTNP